jgi:effector-binding domain-containing protein
MTQTYAVHMADLQEQPVAVVCGRITMNEVADFLGGAFGEAMAVVAAQGLHPAGAPFARYRFAEGEAFDVEAGFPVSAPVTASGRVEPATLPGGRVASTMHVGDYADVGAAYDAAAQFLTDEGYELAGAPWESYLDDPTVAEPRTEVFMPCRRLRPAGEPQPEDGLSL